VPPRRPIAGQASAEYVALLALLVAVLAGAGLLVAPPALGAKVSRALRTAICIVGGDVCRSADARAAGLAPCPVREDTRGAGGGLSVAFVELGGGDELTLTRRSDGSVVVTSGQHERGGVGLGLGTDLSPLGVHLVADASMAVRFADGQSWELADEAAAARFVRAVRAGGPLPAPTWTYREAGESADLEVGAGGAGGAALVTVGRRAGRGQTTWYVAGRAEGAVLDALDVDGLPGGQRSVVLEHTTDGTGPRELVFRVARAGASGRAEEVTGRLDLRDPANRAVAERLLRPRLPTGPALLADLRAVARRVREAGTIEWAAYDVQEDDGGFELSAKLGLELGLRVERVRRTRRLTDASVWSAADGDRRRVDCTGGLG
jgi:hypothetical protein